MPYVPNTDDDRRKMLARIGVGDIDELLAAIPRKLRLDRALDIPALSEMELLAEIDAMARANRNNLTCFAGGGVYDHFIPSAVGAVVSRPEFMTAYTPYQPEVAQGTLQVIYEFQSHICRLTGMDVANASMYDGATAAAEAAMLTCRATRRDRVLVSATVSPLVREVMRTYLQGCDVELATVPMQSGLTDAVKLKELVDDRTACVLIGQPNFFGALEDIEALEPVIHESGAKLIMSVDPIAQALLKTPGEYGADVCVGEGQPLGIPMSSGGPLLGFFAVAKKLVRSMPGRIAGRTTDVDGKDGFVLTLQTREQHIRREKATSNICTNQALCATSSAVYMTLMGRTGLKKVALLSTEKAQAAARALTVIDGVEPYFDAPFVREFAIKTPLPAADVVQAALERGILVGIDAGRWYPEMNDCLIVAVTEKRTTEDIEKLAAAIKEIAGSYAVSQV